MTLVEKLRVMGSLKSGEMFPAFIFDGSLDWGNGLSKLCNEAADRIEELEKIQDLLFAEPPYPT